MNSRTSPHPVPVHLLIVALLALAALLPAAASASGGKAEYPLPDPKTTKIEIPGSIGGVSLGQTRKEALSEWGRKAECKDDFCHWGPKRYPDKGEASIRFDDGVVAYVGIGWSPQFVDGKRPIRRSITKFHTADGIRLKSTAKEAKKAFEGATTVFPGNDLLYKFATDEATMYFHVGRFVERIEILPPGFEYNGE